MARKTEAQAFLQQLPASARRKLNLVDLKAIAGALLIRDRIEQFFDDSYRREASLRKFKREHGYCGGRVTCLAFTGDGRTCRPCLDAMANPKRTNTHSEYGLAQLERKRAARRAKHLR